MTLTQPTQRFKLKRMVFLIAIRCLWIVVDHRLQFGVMFLQEDASQSLFQDPTPILYLYVLIL